MHFVDLCSSNVICKEPGEGLMGVDDADLMQRWRQGDAAAFERLVRRWEQPVGRMLARLVNRPELIQDLCQEVFLRVYLAGPKYRESGDFGGWIYRIALNVARDAGRKLRRQPMSLANHEPADSTASAEKACAEK